MRQIHYGSGVYLSVQQRVQECFLGAHWLTGAGGRAKEVDFVWFGV